MEKKEPKIKILVACHKADPAIRQDDIYMPIHVGRALHPELDLGFQGDDTGDNISEKNGSYCELTAMYWAWKNLPKDVDIVGLCHYRRYFKLDKKDPKRYILSLLKKHDAIILPYHVRELSNVDVLAQLTCFEDAALFVDLLVDLFPNWKKEIGKYFYQRNCVSSCNMLIMPRNIFDAYCSFLFPILENLEEVLLPASYARMQRRIGYFAETMLGFWLEMNKLTFAKVFYDEYAENWLIRNIRNIRQHISYRMFKHTPFAVYSAVSVGLKQDGLALKHIVAK